VTLVVPFQARLQIDGFYREELGPLEDIPGLRQSQFGKHLLGIGRKQPSARFSGSIATGRTVAGPLIDTQDPVAFPDEAREGGPRGAGSDDGYIKQEMVSGKLTGEKGRSPLEVMQGASESLAV